MFELQALEKWTSKLLVEPFLGKLEQELVQFKDALGSLYNEVARS